MWNVKIFTIFPEMFPGPLAHSIAGKAMLRGDFNIEAIDIRNYATDKHRSVDDTPYGGGAGMVMRPDCIGSALKANLNPEQKIIYPSPRGIPFTQSLALELANEKNVAMLCGRFEGIDERILSSFPIQEVSVGDFILSGGETAAFVMLDACIRLLPGVVGDPSSLEEESFGTGAYAHLLEYPLYTRPMEWNEKRVPEVLCSGNHAAINQWRLEQAQTLTSTRRPDLWQKFLAAKNRT
jgi:tRNA (guanine37-N1)-methyltransferase